MATLKRNDPCLCGSGKKYKKCCLITLQAKPKFDQADQRAFNELLPKLFDYSKEFDEEIQPVYEKYVQSFESLPKADAQAFSQLLFHWMLFNYPLDQENQTIIDHYVTKQSATYTDKFQQFLQGWKDLEPKLFRITASDAKNIVVYDVFQDQSMTLEKTPASSNLSENDRLIGYLYPTPTGFALGNDAIAIPNKLEESFLSHWHDLKQIAHPLNEQNYIQQSVFTKHFHEVLEVLSLITISGKALQAEETLNDKSKQVLDILFKKLDWSSASFISFLHAKVSWITFVIKHSPRIQKPETFAAALEYWISKQSHSNVVISQKKLAEKYQISAGTISSKYKLIKE